MHDSDGDEGLPDAKPGCEEWENDGLDEEGDEAVDGHDKANMLGGHAKAAGDVEG